MNLIKRTNIPNDASGIYQIKSKLNGKVYVGSAINLRGRRYGHFGNLKNKNHCNIHLQNHYNKYGDADLQFSILKFCEKEKLIEYEQFYIDTLNPKFNICQIAGSILGIMRSKETKQKMSAAGMGRYCSEETKQKLRISHIGQQAGKNNPNYGKHPSEETREKLRKSHMGIHPSKETREKLSKALIGKNKGKNNGMFGKHPSEETRQKLSITHAGKNNGFYGKQHSKKALQKNKDAHLGKLLSEEHKQKISAAGKEAWRKRKELALRQIGEVGETSK